MSGEIPHITNLKEYNAALNQVLQILLNFKLLRTFLKMFQLLFICKMFGLNICKISI